MYKFAKENIKSILVLKWSALGDVVISSAIFEDIRAAFPDAKIDLQTTRAYQKLFADDPRFNAVHTVDLKAADKGIAGMLRVLKGVRNEAYDLVIDLQSNDRSRMFLSLLRLMSAGQTKMVGLHQHFPYHFAPAQGSPAGFLRQQLAIKSLEIEARTGSPRLYVPDSNQSKVNDLLRQHNLTNSSFVIFIPGSNPAGKLKRWGAHRYAALADTLFTMGIGPSVLVGGPDDQQECEDIMAQVKRPESVVNLCCKTDILDIVPLAENAGFIVGSDTGPAHVASAAGCPMLIICGPTDPKRVKPVGDHVEAMQADIDCINCYKKECDHHSCMKAITVDMVLNKIEEGMRK